MATISNKYIAVAVVVSALTSACNDEVSPTDYVGTKPLESPNVVIDTLAFDLVALSWQPVTSAVQYGYRLEDTKGNLLDGGLLSVPNVEIDELTYRTAYRFSAWSYAELTGESTTSAQTVIEITTPFFPEVTATGTYTPSLLSNTWEATLSEVRTSEDKDFGTFTLAAWYNHEGYDLEFRSNLADSTIEVLNGEIDEETGWVKVLAGPTTGIKTNQYVRKGVLIDETRCRFDRTNQQIRIFARSTKDASREGYDVFEW